MVLDALDFDAPKTAEAAALLEALGIAGRKLLLVVDGLEEAAIKSFRNLPTVRLLTFDQLNTYDVLGCDVVVFTRDSLEAFLGRGREDGQPQDELVLENGGGSGGLKSGAGTQEEGDHLEPSGSPPADRAGKEEA
jgi:hypothetical protein